MFGLCCFKFYAWALAIISIAFFIFIQVMKAIEKPYSQMRQDAAEQFFLDPNTNKKVKFPSILSAASVYLSVIVPSYNEEKRLPAMLDEAIESLEKRKEKDPKFTYEIIIVDDGSRDNTSKVGLEYSKKYGTDTIRVLTQTYNRGKGGAVRMGVMKSRGKLILFADADGASKFSDYEKLENTILKNTSSLDTDEIIVCGSRRHLEKESVAKRSAFRTFLMYGFHFLVWFLCVKGVRDTQCGFKMFTRCAAIKSFSNLHVQRWAFDVDILYIASYFRMKIYEVDINWEEKDGSKVNFFSYFQMGRDLVFIRLHYLLAIWKLDPNLRHKLD